VQRTLVSRRRWHPMTRRAMSGRPCREGFEALSFEADVSDESDVVRMFESVAQWGQGLTLVRFSAQPEPFLSPKLRENTQRIP